MGPRAILPDAKLRHTLPVPILHRAGERGIRNYILATEDAYSIYLYFSAKEISPC